MPRPLKPSSALSSQRPIKGIPTARFPLSWNCIASLIHQLQITLTFYPCWRTLRLLLVSKTNDKTCFTKKNKKTLFIEHYVIRHQGGNSQNFLHKFVIFFLYGVVIDRKSVFICFYVVKLLLISDSKTTFSQYNLKILRVKVTKNLTNFLKKFCEFPPRAVASKIL